MDTAELPRPPLLKKDLRTEVCVVGAAAPEFAKENVNVAGRGPEQFV